MTTTQRTPVYISTPLQATEADLSKAQALATLLFNQGCLPIMPFLYQLCFQPSEADYIVLCEALFKQADEVFSIGTPPANMVRLFEARGITPRIV